MGDFRFLGPQPYHSWAGKWTDQNLLRQLMHQAYQELWPKANLSHLNQTIEQLWSDQTGLWFLGSTLPEVVGQTLGCIWLGMVIDPVSGDRHPHIFLLYVSPAHRRRGLGTALMKSAEHWAQQQGHSQIGLHVFMNNLPAQALYLQLGYNPQAMVLQKRLYPHDTSDSSQSMEPT